MFEEWLPISMWVKIAPLSSMGGNRVTATAARYWATKNWFRMSDGTDGAKKIGRDWFVRLDAVRVEKGKPGRKKFNI